MVRVHAEAAAARLERTGLGREMGRIREEAPLWL